MPLWQLCLGVAQLWYIFACAVVGRRGFGHRGLSPTGALPSSDLGIQSAELLRQAETLDMRHHKHRHDVDSWIVVWASQKVHAMLKTTASGTWRLHRVGMLFLALLSGVS